MAERFPEIHLDCVGIYGWSFGGYLAAMALMRHPKVFHAGVCGAPVPDQEQYDTHYAERYLGNPAIDPSPYKVSNLETYAASLSRPLLLIHGTADDNCYFSGTIRLLDILMRSGQDFEFLPLPNQTHVVTEPEIVVALWERVARYFDKHLAHASAPDPGRRDPSVSHSGVPVRR
jgi:dipeptidyl-peptidase-4